MTDGGNWETVDQNTVKKKLSTLINLIRKKQKKAKRQQLVGEAEHALLASVYPSHTMPRSGLRAERRVHFEVDAGLNAVHFSTHHD